MLRVRRYVTFRQSSDHDLIFLVQLARVKYNATSVGAVIRNNLNTQWQQLVDSDNIANTAYGQTEKTDNKQNCLLIEGRPPANACI